MVNKTQSAAVRGRALDPLLEAAPIRAEIFSAERFEQHARSLADSQTVVGRRRPPSLSILGEKCCSS